MIHSVYECRSVQVCRLLLCNNQIVLANVSLNEISIQASSLLTTIAEEFLTKILKNSNLYKFGLFRPKKKYNTFIDLKFGKLKIPEKRYKSSKRY